MWGGYKCSRCGGSGIEGLRADPGPQPSPLDERVPAPLASPQDEIWELQKTIRSQGAELKAWHEACGPVPPQGGDKAQGREWWDSVPTDNLFHIARILLSDAVDYLGNRHPDNTLANEALRILSPGVCIADAKEKRAQRNRDVEFVREVEAQGKGEEGEGPRPAVGEAKKPLEDLLVRDGLYQEWLERVDWEHDDSVESAFLGGLDAALRAAQRHGGGASPEPSKESPDTLDIMLAMAKTAPIKEAPKSLPMGDLREALDEITDLCWSAHLVSDPGKLLAGYQAIASIVSKIGVEGSEAPAPAHLLKAVLEKACNAVYEWSDVTDSHKKLTREFSRLMEELDDACIAALPPFAQEGSKNG